MSKNFVISNLNPLLIKWDMFIVFLALYSCIIIPLHLSFLPDIGSSVRLDVIIDFMFFLDIVITFRTTAMNLTTGEEIIKPKEIAIHYIKGRFFIDVLSALPIDKLIRIILPNINHNSAKHLVIFSCLKLIRILRINRLLIYLNSSVDIKHTIRLIKMCFFLLLYLHFTACIWYFIITLGKEKVSKK